VCKAKVKGSTYSFGDQGMIHIALWYETKVSQICRSRPCNTVAFQLWPKELWGKLNSRKEFENKVSYFHYPITLDHCCAPRVLSYWRHRLQYVHEGWVWPKEFGEHKGSYFHYPLHCCAPRVLGYWRHRLQYVHEGWVQKVASPFLALYRLGPLPRLEMCPSW
jgi:hypothetical protein